MYNTVQEELAARWHKEAETLRNQCRDYGKRTRLYIQKMERAATLEQCAYLVLNAKKGD